MDLLKRQYHFKEAFKFYCDNEGVIKIIASKEKIISPSEYDRKHSDLQQTLQLLTRQVCPEAEFRHIYAHQNKRGPKRYLSI